MEITIKKIRKKIPKHYSYHKASLRGSNSSGLWMKLFLTTKNLESLTAFSSMYAARMKISFSTMEEKIEGYVFDRVNEQQRWCSS